MRGAFTHATLSFIACNRQIDTRHLSWRAKDRTLCSAAEGHAGRRGSLSNKSSTLASSSL
jgi:hypothetical protein